MISKKVLALFLAISSISALAQKKQESNSYFDIGYSTFAYSDSSFNFKPTGIRAVYGKNTSENLGWEGLLGIGMNEDTATFSSASLGLKIGTVLGVYAKGFIKPSDSFEIFGRLGYASVSRELSCTPVARCVTSSAKDTGNSISYGAGLKFDISKNVSIGGDYMSYYNREGISINATSIGVSFGF
jgi:opacity protein-like surface antigen